MSQYKKPEKLRQSAQARTCLTKSEYAALGRYARVSGLTVSALMRRLILAELAGAAAAKGQ
ncbi:hypothetical protein APY04_1862 [Hyphomicrobium sulfonivorans]|uniref:Ribbon-helix-helix protein CopG domain-containing protein n=1 Tax=Hyphomicrobium sulfonivorans TaxID=121290 RepID=A0A109BES6_HYPSL|nr:hypothetical protein [Hyphomicrobium sulfonivorans]KWT67503.1 hypothetical protein APY04_1862 [Hyphomicrobium sulfonivorans]